MLGRSMDSFCVSFDLNVLAGRRKLFFHVQLGVSLAANKLQFQMAVYSLPACMNYYARCESHQLAITALRPMDTHAVIGPLYALSRLLRFRRTREALAAAFTKRVREECTILLGPPRRRDIESARILHVLVLDSLDRWGRQCAAADVLPRVSQARQSVIDNLPLFRRMFNGLGHDRVTHYCSLPGGGRCCRTNEDAKKAMVQAVETVVLPYLLHASPDPTTVKWFSCSLKLRGIALANGVHGLLGRTWSATFYKELREADIKAREDDLPVAPGVVEDIDWQKVTRKRHRKAAQFLEREGIQETILSILAGVQPVEQLQISLCCLDSARKKLGARIAKHSHPTFRRIFLHRVCDTAVKFSCLCFSRVAKL